jgi:hypothetical protein
MAFIEWSFILGAALSVALAAGPWMFKVHAKLAVIASKVVDLCDKLDRTQDEHRRLWEVCSRHESRLDTHDVQLSHIAERLRGE